VSHTTYFRNHFSGKHVEAKRNFMNTKLFDLCRFSYYQNVVGNVLGTPDWPRSTIGRYEMIGMPGYTEQTCVYRLGYPNMGNNGYSATNPPSNADDGGLDPKVKTTLLRWGNFDYQNNAARWESSEIPSGVTAPATHTLPASFYLAAKPAWWNNLPWPPIGPDVSLMVNKIPAQVRYENDVYNNPSIKFHAPSSPLSFRLISVNRHHMKYEIPKAGHVKLEIYNIAGKRIQILESGHREAGSYTIPLKSKEYAFGIYQIRLQVSNVFDARKILIME
jgi:hypothetical protein